ncbi:MAG: phosphoribosylamine--glycine ligase [Acidobacteriota bacterium]
MRVLVIGYGGREHAICWKLRQSPLVTELYCAPGNPGIAAVADRVPIGISDIIELADFAEGVKVDLTVVGPELPLTLGIVDEFQKRELTIVGPTRLAAELEGSKAFSKEFMKRHSIPTAEAAICASRREAEAAIARGRFPLVIKVSGLAAGKGVLIARSRSEAEEKLDLIYTEKHFGNAADRILIEDFLEGDEISFLVLTDGTRIVPLAPAQDYKRVFAGETGPNTGGMGSHSPAVLSADSAAEIMRTIVMPTVQGMERDGRPYSGCLYVGLMMTADGPKVLEYNCRFGDPETQSQLLRLEDDLAELLLKVGRGNLAETRLSWKKEAAVCVVLAADGYPGDVVKGDEITIDPISDESVVLFHAGTEIEDEKLVTVGGRVISVCARGQSLPEAMEKAYMAVSGVRFRGRHYRPDIGQRALEMLREGAE